MMQRRRLPFVTILALLLILLLPAGCSRKPLVPVTPDALPLLQDGLGLSSLKQAVQSNLAYLLKQPQDKIIHLGEKPVPLQRLTLSLRHFLMLLEDDPSPDELHRRVRQDFDIFQATGTRGFNPGRRMLVTGYFQPVFAGSLTRGEQYRYPLYTMPDDLVLVDNPAGSGKVYRRLENGRTVPYWTRKEIELEGHAAGKELVWLKDPFDAFVLHVQGSGLIRLPDGSVRAVHYAAKNGRPYISIGRYMVETGRIPLEQASLATIRKYLADHPGQRQEILHQNPSFIFFNWSTTRGAVGNLGRELTAGRSIAVDQECFPAGGLAFLSTRAPSTEPAGGITWKPLNRFVVVQDTGSAIRGPGRVDLFWGTGSQAGREAGMMKENGALFFLLLKESLNRQRKQG